jgi:hypothetical protein
VAAALLFTAAAGVLDAVYLRSLAFVRLPSWLRPYAPPRDLVARWREAAAAARPAGRRLAEGVTLIIIDGLRQDVARDLPALEALRARGRGAVLRAPFPSFSRPGYASMLTGAPPRVHGFLSNENERPSPIESVVDAARRAGVATRLLTYGHTWIADMFPAAFEEVVRLREPDLPGPPGAGRPRLDVVYLPEPDETAHEQGGASAAYRAKAIAEDGLAGRIAGRLDLGREAVIVATDHGHTDRGGHGGGEAIVRNVPFVEAGAGVAPDSGPADGAPLAAVAAEVARLLGLEPPPAEPALVAEGEAAGAPRFALLALAVLGLGLAIVFARDLRAASGALAAPALFAAFYAAPGWPFSFSLVNDTSMIPAYAGATLAMGIAASAVGFLLAGRPLAYPALALAAGAAPAVFLGALAGPGAAAALSFPRLSCGYHLALAFCAADGLFCAAIGFLFRAGGVRADTTSKDSEPS